MPMTGNGRKLYDLTLVFRTPIWIGYGNDQPGMTLLNPGMTLQRLEKPV